MSVKELAKITVTDLWREFNSIGDFWDLQAVSITIRASRELYMQY